jgi:hypothetical protein
MAMWSFKNGPQQQLWGRVRGRGLILNPSHPTLIVLLIRLRNHKNSALMARCLIKKQRRLNLTPYLKCSSLL